MNRRDFIKAVAGLPFLSALALEMEANPSGFDDTDTYLIKSDMDYVISVGNSKGLTAQTKADSFVADFRGKRHLSGVFGVNEANFEWREFAFYVDGMCVRRVKQNQGTKSPGQIWTVKFPLDVNIVQV